ncbi:MAG: hypothetical protein JW892_06080 [Anaerolineae bacterium]|nr:hypothetical protein [Anaerolineae bacterium]
MQQKSIRVLMLNPTARRHWLRTLHAGQAGSDPREDTTLLGGEALCQFLLRENSDALILARGPLPFLAGNKLTVGYLSPLTGVPHYSFVGGRAAAELLNLGLDAIVFNGESAPSPTADTYLVISGRAPNLTIEWKSAADLPAGQRGAYYHLLARELTGQIENGSILTLGQGARLGCRTANLAVEGLYHAGRGGAGHVFARFTAALVLHGTPLTLEQALGPHAEAFRELRERELRPLLERYGARLSSRDGGTVTKLYATGSGANPTLPARNAQRLGYALADLGARKLLLANRTGQTGCHWCQVNCRHWHWVDVNYAPGGRDRFLDDFEPTYAIFAMLDLRPEEDSLKGRLRLLEEVDRRLIVPLEQLGCDIIDMGVGLAALFEGVEAGLIPPEDLPPGLRGLPVYLGNLEAAERAIAALTDANPAPALHALGDGPQALAKRYPALREHIFTCGAGTLGNPGHANALWTFLMPFSRFFGHYSGQIYKIPGELTPDMRSDAIETLFRNVIQEMLQRECFGILGNVLSQCAFTFVIFSEEGKGITLDTNDLLVRTLTVYGIELNRTDLEWFAQAFWAQSLALKAAHGWRPPSAADFPARVFEVLAPVLKRPPAEVSALMDRLIAEWRRQAGALMAKFGYVW